jgi:hypothetical protein
MQVSPNDLAGVARPDDPNSALRVGFVVAFGKDLTNDPNDLMPVTFGPGQIDDNTFEIFILDQTRATAFPTVPFWAKLPRTVGTTDVSALIPVNVDALDVTGRVTKATGLAVPASGFVKCTGAAVVVDPAQIERLKGRRLLIEIKCDFIVEVDGKRPIDGNFLLGNLPTGDGVPGGTFWSWVQL